MSKKPYDYSGWIFVWNLNRNHTQAKRTLRKLVGAAVIEARTNSDRDSILIDDQADDIAKGRRRRRAWGEPERQWSKP